MSRAGPRRADGKRLVVFVEIDRCVTDAIQALTPGIADARAARTVADRVMPDAELLRIADVAIRPGWPDRPRVAVSCARCGEGISVTDGPRSRAYRSHPWLLRRGVASPPRRCASVRVARQPRARS